MGYKVNSERAVQFRKWASGIVESFTIKGFAMDDERLKNDGSVLTNPREQYSAHMPALHLLCNLGWNFLTTAQALALRGSTREVLLKPRLIEVLQTRRYEYKGEWYPLSPSGIDQIVRELSALSLAEGLMPANERLYGKLALGITVTEFMPDGKKHQPTIAVIDWADATANRWNVTEELEVLAAQGTHHRTPDVVAYVNGIPLVVIEAKRPESGGGVASARARQAHVLPREYVSGESLHYLGRRYRLKLVLQAGARAEARMRGAYITVTASDSAASTVRAALDAWYRQRAREVFADRLVAVAAPLRWVRQLPPTRLRFMTVQWGSCSPSGRVTLNPLLVKAPRECIDYVLLHELCHLLHHNHSPRFYRTLDRHMPDWRAVKARLDSMAEEVLRI